MNYEEYKAKESAKAEKVAPSHSEYIYKKEKLKGYDPSKVEELEHPYFNNWYISFYNIHGRAVDVQHGFYYKVRKTTLKEKYNVIDWDAAFTSFLGWLLVSLMIAAFIIIAFLIISSL